MNPNKHYNYMLGTQAFSPNYQFENVRPEIEIGGRICELGSNMIKFYLKDESLLDELMKKGDFSYVFMWYRSDSHFRNGYTHESAEADYNAFYALTKKLLTDYNKSGVTFYLGHWEGDWYYLDNYNTEQQNVDNIITTGMIKWLNNRQKAIDDAKRETPHEDVYVWNYAEINRPHDALRKGFDRVVNRVLPDTNVDYVSYSAYDTMDLPASEVQETIKYIYSKLPHKENVPGPRVFIGEMGQPAANCGFDGERHCHVNMANISKYLRCEVKHILYWQMYCNEKLEDGSSRGFWLINDQNIKQPLFNHFESVLKKTKEYVSNFTELHSREPDNTEYREFLLSLPEFQFTEDTRA